MPNLLIISVHPFVVRIIYCLFLFVYVCFIVIININIFVVHHRTLLWVALALVAPAINNIK